MTLSFLSCHDQQVTKKLGAAEAFLLKEVRVTVNKLLQIMQAYRSNDKFSRILASYLLKRRQDEADMAIDKTIARLQASYTAVTI